MSEKIYSISKIVTMAVCLLGEKSNVGEDLLNQQDCYKYL